MKRRVLSVFLALCMIVSVTSALSVTASAAATTTLDGFYWPLVSNTKISSGFGEKRTGQYHQGIDIPAKAGTAIYAAKSGTVYEVGYQSTMGYYICIYHGQLSNGLGLYTTYMHMQSRSSLSVNSKVTVNTILGYTGDTGAPNNYHLHFHISQCDNSDWKPSPKHTTVKELNENYINSSPSNIAYTYRTTPPTSNSLKINLTTKPTSITQGNSFGLYGTVTSGSKITKVQGYVINASGKTVLTSTDTPNSTSLNIQKANLNNKLTFNKLAVGTYTMKVVATDASGNSVTWSKTFKVTK